MEPAAQFLERVEVGGALPAEQPVPGGGAEPRHTGQTGIRVTEAERSSDGRQIRQHLPYGVLAARLDRADQEQRRVGQRGHDGLDRDGIGNGVGHARTPGIGDAT